MTPPEVVGVLGRGGLATVYLAYDRLRADRVALKVVHDNVAHSSLTRRRLRHEIHSAARTRHPHALVASEFHELDGHLASQAHQRVSGGAPPGGSVTRLLEELQQKSRAAAEAYEEAEVACVFST